MKRGKRETTNPKGSTAKCKRVGRDTRNKQTNTEKHNIPTAESKIYGGEICNIYRWYATKAGIYLNNKMEFGADLNHLNTPGQRIQNIRLRKDKNETQNQNGRKNGKTTWRTSKLIRKLALGT